MVAEFNQLTASVDQARVEGKKKIFTSSANIIKRMICIYQGITQCKVQAEFKVQYHALERYLF